MFNRSLSKVPMPLVAPQERIQNFDEVSLGYTSESAIEEANRCLNCRAKPCVSGCPVEVDIPNFIDLIKNGKFLDAYATIKRNNSLPAICGRVCPQESQCESKCIRGIKGEPVAIGRLERFVSDYVFSNDKVHCSKKTKNGRKVAVVGAGPAGLTCACELNQKGYDVTIFEAFHTPGGVLVYGIPEFRLPKRIVQKEIESLLASGVEIQTNMVIGKVLTIDELREQGYEAFFIGSGAGTPKFMNLEGESLIGVYSANEYLTRINLMKAYRMDYDTPIRRGRKIAVIGGGNVAMDAARCAKRLGAEEVYLVYRRSKEEMPARKEEVEHALEEGIAFKLLTNPTRFIGNAEGEVVGMECLRMDLSEPDESGRRRPLPIKDSNFILEVDTIILAIGTSPNPLLMRETAGLEIDRWGCLVVDEHLATSVQGIYAGGDVVTGAATVILAMGAGKKAATSIDRYLKEKGYEKTVDLA